ncbi:MAG: hypothetical protein DLM69_02270 [Candidatus Chloroheliales bacterium]|nr:MAG: hypothetical protein DLM69_02270 [Chloroflexota bacterium]
MAKGGGIISKLASANFTVQDYIAVVLGLLLPIFFAGIAITQVASWTADEENGIDDMVLTTPHERWSVLLNRFAAITVALLIMFTLIGLTVTLTASISGISYDTSKMWAALVQLLPFTMLVVAVGFVIAAWLKQPGPAVLLVSAFVLVSFVIYLLGQGKFLKLPDFVSALSIFHEYGTPASTGLDPWATLGLSAAALVLLAAAIVGFQRRDMAKGLGLSGRGSSCPCAFRPQLQHLDLVCPVEHRDRVVACPGQRLHLVEYEMTWLIVAVNHCVLAANWLV